MAFFGGFPFGQFAGSPFGDGDDDPRFGGAPPRGKKEEKKEINNKKYYETLGIDQKATPDQIKKAFRKLSVTKHPDKGGDTEEYKQITTAYTVLSDPEKRKIYDQYGEEGLEGGNPGGPGGEGFDIFKQFFEGGHGQPGPQRERKRKAKPVLHLLDLSLADVYTGTKKKMKITRERICKECNGKGGKEDSISECTVCKGNGRVVKTITRGFMMTQTIAACDACRGRGKTIKDKCKTCGGACVVQDVKVQNIDVEKGTPDGYRYTFAGEADEYPGIEAGDIIIEVQLRKDKRFRRKGADLYIERDITLFEALAGTKFELDHLDGRKVALSTPENKIISHGEVLCAEELGMPFFGRSYKYGSLFITFSVQFPKTLTEAQMKAVKDSLKSGDDAKRIDPSVTSEYKLGEYKGTEADLEAHLKKQAREDDDDDDDSMRGGQRVQCAQQ